MVSELDDVIYKLKTVSRVRRVTHRTVTGGSMAHSVNCKLLHSYRRWNSFQKQPLHKDCRKLRVTCANNGSPGTQNAEANLVCKHAQL